MSAKNIQVSGGESSPAKRTWTVGTLTYTSTGLAALMGWLLWGDFAWQMRERTLLPIVQLLLKKFGISDTLMALLIHSLPSIIGLLYGPYLFSRSDHHRGRWGRRIPYLFFTTPLIVVGFLALTFSPLMGEWVQKVFSPSWGLNRSVLTFMAPSLLFLELACGVSAGMFLCLIRDVVPQTVMGRFFGVFRVVSLVVGIVFQYWLFGKAEAHYVSIFLTVCAIYGLGLLTICWKVKEGTYPPPPPTPQGESLIKRFNFAVKSFCETGYGNGYYWWYYAAAILSPMALQPANLFNVFYAKSIGVDMSLYGKYMAYSFVVSMCIAYPLGSCADRFHPLRMTLGALGFYMLVILWSALYATNSAMFCIGLMAQSVAGGIFASVFQSFPLRMLPADRYGQIGSACGILGCLIGSVFVSSLGLFLDLTHHAYHMVYYVGFGISVLAILVNLVLHRKFMALGGPKNYVAP